MLGDNIIYLRKERGWTQSDLAEKLEIARTTLGDYERGRTEPGLDMLRQFSGLFGISLDVLLNQRLHAGLRLERMQSHVQLVPFDVDFSGMQHVDLVETKAEAGYLESFQDPEYIRDLPKLYIPNLPKNDYRGFQIEGESMLPLESGSIVIGSYVDTLEGVKDHHTYVIVTRRDGLVYKRIQKLPDRQALLAVSDNALFPPYEIAYEEISEMWRYQAHISFSDTQRRKDTELYDRIEDIQRKVDVLYGKYGE